MTRRVLVADDTPQIRKVFAKVLERDGIEVTEVDNGDAVFETTISAQVGLILLDLDMPGRDHSENLEMLKANAETSNIPVVIITGNDDRSELEQVLKEGASDYIIKPPNLTQLRNRVNAYLGISALTRQAGKMTEERRQLYLAIARLAESLEPDYLHHGLRVSRYSEMLCEQLQSAGKKIPNSLEIGLASSLHDIGKTSLPRALLMKEGALDEEERRDLEAHCVHGAEALDAYALSEDNSLFLSTAKEIILGHHERWDGQGYPSHKSGEEIPLSARIVSVAEVYDALTSRRPYRAACTHQEAVGKIQEGSGTQFDPEIVEAFCSVCEAFPALRASYPN